MLLSAGCVSFALVHGRRTSHTVFVILPKLRLRRTVGFPWDVNGRPTQQVLVGRYRTTGTFFTHAAPLKGARAEWGRAADGARHVQMRALLTHLVFSPPK